MHNRLVAAVAAAALLSACGGGSGTGGTGPSQVAAAAFTITASGVSPKSVTVPRGSQVQFTNTDRNSHSMNSDPHPEHTDCPEINAVGYLVTGQSRNTENLNTVRTCGFHDHDDPNNNALKGSIVIQ